MIKIYCDKCGKHITFGFFSKENIKELKMLVNDERFHFCGDCYNKFLDWKNDKEVREDEK